MSLRKQLTEKTVYKPNKDVTVTVTNTPIVEDEVVKEYKRTLSVSIRVERAPERLEFKDGDALEKYLTNVEYGEAQTSLDV